MLDDDDAAARLALLDAIATAHAAGRAEPGAVESPLRTYARLRREGGVGIEAFLLEVKQMLIERAGRDEPLFRPRVVGWAVAGFYARTGPRDEP